MNSSGLRALQQRLRFSPLARASSRCGNEDHLGARVGRRGQTFNFVDACDEMQRDLSSLCPCALEPAPSLKEVPGGDGPHAKGFETEEPSPKSASGPSPTSFDASTNPNWVAHRHASEPIPYDARSHFAEFWFSTRQWDTTPVGIRGTPIEIRRGPIAAVVPYPRKGAPPTRAPLPKPLGTPASAAPTTIPPETTVRSAVPIPEAMPAIPPQNGSTSPAYTVQPAPTYVGHTNGNSTIRQEHQDLDDVPNAKPYPSKKKWVEARGRVKTKKTTFFHCKVQILAVRAA